VLLTPTEISAYCSISGTITQTQIDAVVRDINLICNNFFVSDLCISTNATFAGGSGGTITIGSSWLDFGFENSDEIYISNSFRNDGYKVVGTISTSVMTLSTSSTAIAELSGRSIYFSVVQWPEGLKSIAAQMVAYVVDDRDAVAANVISHSLGPFSESFGGNNSTGDANPYGYPAKLTNLLNEYRIAGIR
jgi:hypothetical protein